MRRSWSIPPSRLRRATVPQFNMVASLRSHRTALRLPGVPWLRTVLRSVCSPLQPFGPPPFAKRTCDVPCFTGVFVPACASLARYSGAAERFALSSPLHPFGASTATACFAHSARPSCAPALTLARCSAPADFASLRVLGAPAASRPPTLASSLAALPASLGLLRAVSPTGRALRASPAVHATGDDCTAKRLRTSRV